MPRKPKTGKEYRHHHKDGTLWVRGPKTGETMTGYWEWFRKDGSRMRSGHFDDDGRQVGEWTTYDKRGKVHKVTMMKPKVPARRAASGHPA